MYGMTFDLLIKNQETLNQGGLKCSVGAVQSCIPDEFTSRILFYNDRIVEPSFEASKIKVFKSSSPLRGFIAALVEK